MEKNKLQVRLYRKLDEVPGVARGILETLEKNFEF